MELTQHQKDYVKTLRLEAQMAQQRLDQAIYAIGGPGARFTFTPDGDVVVVLPDDEPIEEE